MQSSHLLLLLLYTTIFLLWTPRSVLAKSGTAAEPEYEAAEDVSASPELIETIQQLQFDEYPKLYPGPKYDPFNCPDTPPEKYPFHWRSSKVLEKWPITNTTIPSRIAHSLCVFDYVMDRKKAETYRKMDMPFIIRNYPVLMESVAKWQDPEHMKNLLNVKNRTYFMHRSNTYEFVWWNPNALEQQQGNQVQLPDGWKQPTQTKRVTYEEYQDIIKRKRDVSYKTTHYHLFVEGYWSHYDENHKWHLFDDFPFFMPGTKNVYHELYEMPHQLLSCSFTTKGSATRMGFDMMSNMQIVMKGWKRYLIASPEYCKQHDLYPANHPSSKQTKIDWEDPSNLNGNARMNEVILQPGDALFVPNYYMFAGQSLTSDDVIECGAKSTRTTNRNNLVQECGGNWLM